MASNKALNRAKYGDEKHDEFYTSYCDVDHELVHYLQPGHFAEKGVYLNCDDGHTSAFFKWFVDNAVQAGYKWCAATGFGRDGSQNVSLYVPGMAAPYHSTLPDASFNSMHSRMLLENCDIVVTNPPFSRMLEHLDLCLGAGKHVIILTHMNMLLSNHVFPHIVEGRLKPGTTSGNMWFDTPDSYWMEGNRCRYKDGHVQRSLGNAMWLTDLTPDAMPAGPPCTHYYNRRIYRHYDGTDILHVPTIKDIPKDYTGRMGVPVSFLTKWDRSAYRIEGMLNHRARPEIYDFGEPYLDGKLQYKRLVISRIGG